MNTRDAALAHDSSVAVPAQPGVAELDEGAEPISIGDRVRKLLAADHEKEPYYPRLLRLKHVQPNGWQRAVLVEGMMVVGGLVALADRATAWAPLILPVGAAAVVKFHDVLAGLLPRPDRDRHPAQVAGPISPTDNDDR